MPKHVVYHAASHKAVHECAYSLLKYLDVYNLKPPADHTVIVHTHDPASLEAYGTFFADFKLLPLEGQASGLAAAKTIAQASGSTLYMGPATYPVSPLEPLFAGMDQGVVYISRPLSAAGAAAEPAVWGANPALPPLREEHPDACVACYGDFSAFAPLLKKFFTRHQEESVPNQVKLLHAIDAATIRLQKKAFERLPLYVRLIRKVLGRGWNISQYGKRL